MLLTENAGRTFRRRCMISVFDGTGSNAVACAVRRTRLFPPGGDIGLVVSIVTIDDARGWDDAREQFWQQVRQVAAKRAGQSKRYEARLIRLADGTFGVREAHIPDDKGPYSSILLFMR